MDAATLHRHDVPAHHPTSRHYMSRIRAVFHRARALMRNSDCSAALRNWQWHRSSARACVDEAVLIYIQGLESLLDKALRVRRELGDGPVRFVCEVEGNSGNFVLPGLDLDQREAAEHARLEAAFGCLDMAVLKAFAEGLADLERFGGFDEHSELRLQPESVPVLAAPVDLGPMSS